mgnify:CR=1 FL=1
MTLEEQIEASEKQGVVEYTDDGTSYKYDSPTPDIRS